MPRRRHPPISDPTDLAAIASRAVKLSQSERMELIAILQALQEAENGTLLEQRERALRDTRKGSPQELALHCRGLQGDQGSFEDKSINGCGSDRYLRR